MEHIEKVLWSYRTDFLICSQIVTETQNGDVGSFSFNFLKTLQRMMRKRCFCCWCGHYDDTYRTTSHSIVIIPLCLGKHKENVSVGNPFLLILSFLKVISFAYKCASDKDCAMLT